MEAVLEGEPATSVLTSGKVDATAKPTPDKLVVALTTTPSGFSVTPAPQNPRGAQLPKPTDLRVGSRQRP
jgi:hypothetical protein